MRSESAQTLLAAAQIMNPDEARFGFEESRDDLDVTAHNNFTSDGEVLFAVNNLRREVQGLSRKLDSTQEEVKEVKRIAQEMASSSAEQGEQIKHLMQRRKLESSPRSGPRRKIARKLQPELPLMEYAFGPRPSAVALICWANIAIVMNFIYAEHSLEAWVSESLRTRIARERAMLLKSTGTAMLFFAVHNNKKSLFGTDTGKIWSFVIRRAVITAMCMAKADLFRSPGAGGKVETESDKRDEPHWVTAFSGPPQIRQVVEEVFDKLEAPNSRESVSTSSTVGNSERSSGRMEDTNVRTSEKLRERAIEEIRYRWMQQLNYGRSRVRHHLYKNVFFILDKIEEYGSRGAAREAGCDVLFCPSKSPVEEAVPSASTLKNSIWDIAQSKLEGNPDFKDSNNAEFENLKKNFPSLWVNFAYKRAVLPRRRSQSRNEPRSPSTWDELEHISLHDVARELLMELFCADSVDIVTCASQLSFKSIHVLAFALRGLLKKTLDEELTTVEQSALGSDISYVEGNDATKTFGRFEAGESYDKPHRDKFEISFVDYEASLARKAQQEKERATENRQNNPEGTTRAAQLGEDYSHDWTRMS